MRPPEAIASKKLLKIIVFIFAAGLILALFLAPFLKKTPKKTVIYDRLLMGTIVEITLREDNPEAAEAAFKEIERLEKIFSHYKAGSDVSRISANAGKGMIKVPIEVVEVIEIALKIGEASSGAFDPTVGALTKKLWDFSKEDNTAPDEGEIKKLLPLVNYKNILLDKNASLAGLKNKNTRLDLGGVAKGYIAGKAIEKLKQHNIEWAILKAGGDMTVYQKDPLGEPFIIGVQHPREKDKLLGVLKVKNGAIATSGDYERFFIKNGVRYHHIIDPKTGYPSNKTQSVTIVSLDPALADALSTAVFVMGPEEGMKLIESLPGVQGIIVDAKGVVSVSRGLEHAFKRF